jgi:hypothetical protein
MSFSWTIFRDKILLNKDFAESISKELEFKKVADGSIILLAANEFLLDPTYTLSFNEDSEVKFPGRYHLVIVADFFDGRGGVINLSGSNGDEGSPGQDGDPGYDENEPGIRGGAGGPGKKGGTGEDNTEQEELEQGTSEDTEEEEDNENGESEESSDDGGGEEGGT